MPESSNPEDQLAAAVATALHAREPTSDAWGLELLAARQGYARVTMRIRDDMLNGHGTAHGGIIFSLADTAFAYACNSRNTATVAAQVSITYLTPAVVGEILVAEAEELAVAGRSGSYAVHVFTPEGRPVAEFQGLSRTTGGTVITQSDNEENHG